MGCTIVVGGQYGSEGKGKVVALISQQSECPWVVRCGGPNSGHTVRIRGEDVVLRQIPTGVILPEALLLVSAGCAVDTGLLIAEADLFEIPQDRVVVDPRAVLISPHVRFNYLERGELKRTPQLSEENHGEICAMPP